MRPLTFDFRLQTLGEMTVLIVPDKFKGTLSARAAAQAIARGWRAARPDDSLELLPMSDGGDGFGEVMGNLLHAKTRITTTVNAAHQPCEAKWWWEANSKTAIVESATVVGLAMLPSGRFHPFALDTFGLGKVLQTVSAAGAKRTLVGIGGSATNDGGFGLARALGWEFYDRGGCVIEQWTALHTLTQIRPPRPRRLGKIIVAVDVQNRLLGARGATRVYGPQKGLRRQDFVHAERCLRRLAMVVSRGLGVSASDGSRRPMTGLQSLRGAGAAGGLGFGLAAFLGAELKHGFELFAQHADLSHRLRAADCVITGEGALDRSTIMGKGVGQIARECRALGIPCFGVAGTSVRSRELSRLFTEVHALTDMTTESAAKSNAAHWLEKLAQRVAKNARRLDPA